MLTETQNRNDNRKIRKAISLILTLSVTLILAAGIIVGLNGPGSAVASSPASEQVEPEAGTWQTWLLESGDEFRPDPPFAYDSPEMAADMTDHPTGQFIDVHK